MPKPAQVSYVLYSYPGAMVSSTGLVAGDTIPAVEQWPPHSFAARLVRRWEATMPDGEVLTGEPKDAGKVHLKGWAYTLSDMRQLNIKHPGKFRVAISNMEGNKWDRLLSCAQGFIPVADDDIIILDEKYKL